MDMSVSAVAVSSDLPPTPTYASKLEALRKDYNSLSPSGNQSGSRPSSSVFNFHRPRASSIPNANASVVPCSPISTGSPLTPVSGKGMSLTSLKSASPTWSPHRTTLAPLSVNAQASKRHSSPGSGSPSSGSPGRIVGSGRVYALSSTPSPSNGQCFDSLPANPTLGSGSPRSNVQSFSLKLPSLPIPPNLQRTVPSRSEPVAVDRGSSAMLLPSETKSFTRTAPGKSTAAEDTALEGRTIFVRDLDSGLLVPSDAVQNEVEKHLPKSPDPQSAVDVPKQPRVRMLRVQYLKEGDVIVVRGFNPVAASQLITQLFAPSVTRLGSFQNIHAMLVTQAHNGFVSVCHSVRTGGSQDYIKDAPPPRDDFNQIDSIRDESQEEEIDHNDQITVHTAAVYRLPDYKHRTLAKAAAKVARDLVGSKRVGFDHFKSIGSAFKFLRVDEPIEWESIRPLLDNRGNPDENRLTLFCSEFIVKSYQAAMLKLGVDSEEFFTRTMSLNGEACSPQALEGYMVANSEKLNDWQYVGDIRYVFC